MRAWPALVLPAVLAGCGDVNKQGSACAPVPDAWNIREAGVIETDGPQNKIYLEHRDIYWNARKVSPETLHHYLDLLGRQEFPGRLVLQVGTTADCEMARAVIAKMKQSTVCREHQTCGTLTRWPDPPPPPGY